jgi:acyl carrier protein
MPIPSEQQIYATLTEIFREVFGKPSLTLDADTNATRLDGWDSFAHVNIIVAVEDRFGVRFRAAEAQELSQNNT